MTATQRKKTDKNKNTTTTDNDDDEITEQLARAQSAVERNHASMQTLHSQWRTQLLRMAYLVMVVTLHIAQTPSSTCIKDIKVSTGPTLRSWVLYCEQSVSLNASSYHSPIHLFTCRIHSNSTRRIQNWECQVHRLSASFCMIPLWRYLVFYVPHFLYGVYAYLRVPLREAIFRPFPTDWAVLHYQRLSVYIFTRNSKRQPVVWWW